MYCSGLYVAKAAEELPDVRVAESQGQTADVQRALGRSCIRPRCDVCLSHVQVLWEGVALPQEAQGQQPPTHGRGVVRGFSAPLCVRDVRVALLRTSAVCRRAWSWRNLGGQVQVRKVVGVHRCVTAPAPAARHFSKPLLGRSITPIVHRHPLQRQWQPHPLSRMRSHKHSHQERQEHCQGLD